MLDADRNAVICDLAETYGILDYKALPVPLLATLCSGLRETSRIKLRLSGMSVPSDVMLLAAAVDKLAWLVWAQTTDGQKGRNRPESVLEELLGRHSEPGRLRTFDSPAAFEAARAAILKGG